MLSSQFYRCSSGIPEFADIGNLCYVVVGEITSTPPSTAHKVLQSGFIGLLSSKMPVSLSYLVMNVKELVILVDVKKCL